MQVDGEGGDIQVLAVCGDSGNVVSPDMHVFYVCQHYSLVFVLDLSPNMRAVVSYSWLGDCCQVSPSALEQL